jgi:hypothetical protein
LFAENLFVYWGGRDLSLTLNPEEESVAQSLFEFVVLHP